MGARVVASTGLALQACGFLVYLTLGLTTSTYVVVLGAVLNGAGSSTFFPANNSAVMASAPSRSYGVVSGLLRTFSNIGMVCSFAAALLVASLSMTRQLAFQIFLGTGFQSPLPPQLSSAFMNGMHAALAGSISVIIVALVLSILRGKEARTMRSPATV